MAKKKGAGGGPRWYARASGRYLPFLARLGRWAIWSALAALAATVAGFVVLRSVLTPEKLRSEIQAQLEDTFRRPVRVDHVTLLLHQGVKVSGLEVQETRDFGGGVLLSSQFLIAKYKLIPLLFGRLEFHKIALDSPRIRLVRRADGVSNVQGIGTAAAGGAGGGMGLPALQVVDDISVERGRLEVVDDKLGFRLLVADFGLKAEDFSFSGPFSLEFSFRNESEVGESTVSARVAFEGKADLGEWRPERSRIEAESLRLEVDGLKAEFSGSWKDTLNPEIRLKAELPALTSEILSRYRRVPPGWSLPPSEWEADLRVVSSSGTPAELRIGRLRAAAGEGRARAALAVSGRVLSDGTGARLSFGLEPSALETVGALYAGWRERSLAGRGEGALAVSGDLRSPEVESLSLKLQEASYAFGPGKSFSGLDGSLTAGRGFSSWEARVTKGLLTAYGSILGGLDVELRAVGENLAVPRLNAVWNVARVRLRGCVEDYRKARKIWTEGRIDRLRTDELYAAVETLIEQRRKERGVRPPPEEKDLWARVFRNSFPDRFPDIAGRLRIDESFSPNTSVRDVELEWDLRSLSHGLGDADGAFRVRFGAGRIRSVPEVRQSHGLLNVLILPFSFMHEMQRKAVASLDTAVLRELDIAQVRGEFLVRDGITDVRYIHFDSPQFIAYADGTADWPREKIDLHVLMRGTRPRGRLPDRLVDTEGRPSIELYLKNDLNRPTPEMSLRKMRADDIETALAGGRSRRLPPIRVEGNLSCGGKSS